MDDLIVAPATSISDEDVVDISRLLSDLTDNRQIAVDQELLRQIIDSEHHVLLLARLSGRVVGMATLGLLLGPSVGRKIYLDDFVTDPTIRGKGVGSKLWEAMLDWGRQHGADKLEFTSHSSRQAAHAFYVAKGATIRNTEVFSKEF